MSWIAYKNDNGLDGVLNLETITYIDQEKINVCYPDRPQLRTRVNFIGGGFECVIEPPFRILQIALRVRPMSDSLKQE